MAVALIAAPLATAAPETSPAASGHDFELSDCDEQYGAFTVPAGEAEPYLPEGFRFAGVGGEPLPDGQATLIVLVVRCDGPGDDEESYQLWTELPVVPTERYRSDGVLLYYIHVVGLTTSPTIADAYRAWNIPRFCMGDISLDMGNTTDGVAVEDAAEVRVANWESELATRRPACAGTPANEESGFRLTTSLVGTHPPLFGGSVRLLGVEDQHVPGIVDVTGDEWKEGFGQAQLVDNDLIPFELEGPAIGGHAWDFDASYRPGS